MRAPSEVRKIATGLQPLGDCMAISFATCPFGVFAGDEGGILIEDRKSGQSWVLTNQQSRVFGRLIMRQRKVAEKHLAEIERARHACPP
jgi:hypothetical protein